ncbi:hypothetical protein [Acinetobacter terrae]|uniref:hypothetical protein n=1 Tax=Acinetobacter terrae TaxID=2731247 RepID=UPI0007D7DC9B|nr:hypothetical protein [Acinetobacter terrae]OAL80339.1 hypothetical protein AY608_05540 [Acinetobacter terrae]
MDADDQARLDAFKRDLYRDIANRKRLFEAETGLAIKDIDLSFVNISTVDRPVDYLLNEIIVTVSDPDECIEVS